MKPANDECRGQGLAERLRMFEGVEPMGRGRAKAKQVKVARQLKYSTDGTDLDRLRTELGIGGAEQDRRDSYGDLADRYNDHESEGEDDDDE
jgi:Protein of unknown function (DUF3073)